MLRDVEHKDRTWTPVKVLESQNKVSIEDFLHS